MGTLSAAQTTRNCGKELFENDEFLAPLSALVAGLGTLLLRFEIRAALSDL